MRIGPVVATLPVLLGCLLPGCGAEIGLRMNNGTDWHSYVRDRSGGPATDNLDATHFKAGMCDGEEQRPDYSKLDETSLLRFLERQHIDARVERPRADLLYVSVGGAGTEAPIRLRVAILGSSDEAGRELYQGILQHGPGSWGVRRSNLAVLGPVGAPGDDIAFAGVTKLACWGVFTIAGTDDAFVVPGGYTEL
jgi:hypothetical protein